MSNSSVKNPAEVSWPQSSSFDKLTKPLTLTEQEKIADELITHILQIDQNIQNKYKLPSHLDEIKSYLDPTQASWSSSSSSSGLLPTVPFVWPTFDLQSKKLKNKLQSSASKMLLSSLKVDNNEKLNEEFISKIDQNIKHINKKESYTTILNQTNKIFSHNNYSSLIRAGNDISPPVATSNTPLIKNLPPKKVHTIEKDDELLMDLEKTLGAFDIQMLERKKRKEKEKIISQIFDGSRNQSNHINNNNLNDSTILRPPSSSAISRPSSSSASLSISASTSAIHSPQNSFVTSPTSSSFSSSSSTNDHSKINSSKKIKQLKKPAPPPSSSKSSKMFSSSQQLKSSNDSSTDIKFSSTLPSSTVSNSFLKDFTAKVYDELSLDLDPAYNKYRFHTKTIERMAYNFYSLVLKSYLSKWKYISKNLSLKILNKSSNIIKNFFYHIIYLKKKRKREELIRLKKKYNEIMNKNQLKLMNISADKIKREIRKYINRLKLIKSFIRKRASNQIKRFYRYRKELYIKKMKLLYLNEVLTKSVDIIKRYIRNFIEKKKRILLRKINKINKILIEKNIFRENLLMNFLYNGAQLTIKQYYNSYIIKKKLMFYSILIYDNYARKIQKFFLFIKFKRRLKEIYYSKSENYHKYFLLNKSQAEINQILSKIIKIQTFVRIIIAKNLLKFLLFQKYVLLKKSYETKLHRLNYYYQLKIKIKKNYSTKLKQLIYLPFVNDKEKKDIIKILEHKTRIKKLVKSNSNPLVDLINRKENIIIRHVITIQKNVRRYLALIKFEKRMIRLKFFRLLDEYNHKIKSVILIQKTVRKYLVRLKFVIKKQRYFLQKIIGFFVGIVYRKKKKIKLIRDQSVRKVVKFFRYLKKRKVILNNLKTLLIYNKNIIVIQRFFLLKLYRKKYLIKKNQKKLSNEVQLKNNFFIFRLLSNVQFKLLLETLKNNFLFASSSSSTSSSLLKEEECLCFGPLQAAFIFGACSYRPRQAIGKKNDKDSDYSNPNSSKNKKLRYVDDESPEYILYKENEYNQQRKQLSISYDKHTSNLTKEISSYYSNKNLDKKLLKTIKIDNANFLRFLQKVPLLTSALPLLNPSGYPNENFKPLKINFFSPNITNINQILIKSKEKEGENGINFNNFNNIQMNSNKNISRVNYEELFSDINIFNYSPKYHEEINITDSILNKRFPKQNYYECELFFLFRIGFYQLPYIKKFLSPTEIDLAFVQARSSSNNNNENDKDKDSNEMNLGEEMNGANRSQRLGYMEFLTALMKLSFIHYGVTKEKKSMKSSSSFIEDKRKNSVEIESSNENDDNNEPFSLDQYISSQIETLEKDIQKLQRTSLTLDPKDYFSSVVNIMSKGKRRNREKSDIPNEPEEEIVMNPEQGLVLLTLRILLNLREEPYMLEVQRWLTRVSLQRLGWSIIPFQCCVRKFLAKKKKEKLIYERDVKLYELMKNYSATLIQSYIRRYLSIKYVKKLAQISLRHFVFSSTSGESTALQAIYESSIGSSNQTISSAEQVESTDTVPLVSVYSNQLPDEIFLSESLNNYKNNNPNRVAAVNEKQDSDGKSLTVNIKNINKIFDTIFFSTIPLRSHWYNPFTNLRTFVKPKILGSSNCITMPLPEPHSAYILPCTSCFQKRSEVICNQCESSSCIECFKNSHSRGKRRSHQYSSIPLCSYCQQQVATKSCISCISSSSIRKGSENDLCFISMNDFIEPYQRGKYCDTCFFHEHQSLAITTKLKHNADIVKSNYLIKKQQIKSSLLTTSVLDSSNIYDNGSNKKKEQLVSINQKKKKNQDSLYNLVKESNFNLILNTFNKQSLNILSNNSLLYSTTVQLNHYKIKQSLSSTNHNYDSIVILCEECNLFSSLFYCVDCEQVYCMNCLLNLHNNNKNKIFLSHKIEILSFFLNNAIYKNFISSIKLYKEKLKINFNIYKNKKMYQIILNKKIITIQSWWRKILAQKLVLKLRLNKIKSLRKKELILYSNKINYYNNVYYLIYLYYGKNYYKKDFIYNTREEIILNKFPMLKHDEIKRFLNWNKNDEYFQQIIYIYQQMELKRLNKLVSSTNNKSKISSTNGSVTSTSSIVNQRELKMKKQYSSSNLAKTRKKSLFDSSDSDSDDEKNSHLNLDDNNSKSSSKSPITIVSKGKKFNKKETISTIDYNSQLLTLTQSNNFLKEKPVRYINNNTRNYNKFNVYTLDELFSQAAYGGYLLPGKIYPLLGKNKMNTSCDLRSFLTSGDVIRIDKYYFIVISVTCDFITTSRNWYRKKRDSFEEEDKVQKRQYHLDHDIQFSKEVYYSSYDDPYKKRLEQFQKENKKNSMYDDQNLLLENENDSPENLEKQPIQVKKKIDENDENNAYYVYRLPSYKDEYNSKEYRKIYNRESFKYENFLSQMYFKLNYRYNLIVLQLSIYFAKLNKKNKNKNEARSWQDLAIKSAEQSKQSKALISLNLPLKDLSNQYAPKNFLYPLKFDKESNNLDYFSCSIQELPIPPYYKDIGNYDPIKYVSPYSNSFDEKVVVLAEEQAENEKKAKDLLRNKKKKTLLAKFASFVLDNNTHQLDEYENPNELDEKLNLTLKIKDHNKSLTSLLKKFKVLPQQFTTISNEVKSNFSQYSNNFDGLSQKSSHSSFNFLDNKDIDDDESSIGSVFTARSFGSSKGSIIKEYQDMINSARESLKSFLNDEILQEIGLSRDTSKKTVILSDENSSKEKSFNLSNNEQKLTDKQQKELDREQRRKEKEKRRQARELKRRMKNKKPWYATPEQEEQATIRESKLSLQELQIEALEWEEKVDFYTGNQYYFNTVTYEVRNSIPYPLKIKRQLDFENSKMKKNFDEAKQRVESLKYKLENRLLLTGKRLR